MKILFEDAVLLPEYPFSGSVYAAVDGAHFCYVGKDRPPGPFDRVINCRGGLLMPAFYNTHCHAAMTLFRGCGDDLPLSRWLDEIILPAEEGLSPELVYWGSLAAIAEMLAGGCVSFSDIYMYEEATARAVLGSGVKANLARGLVSFDEDIDMAHDKRFAEASALWREFDGAGEGRLRIEMALNAEYTNVKSACRQVSDFCRENNIAMQIHLSETEREHNACIAKYGMTPAEFFDAAGALDLHLTAAHCVWLTESDIALLAEKGVFVSHNPSSNLKLGSGIMPYGKIKESGIKISLGTDGAASNNSLNIMKEMQLAALLHRGIARDATAASAAELLECATVRGAAAQGRVDCGVIAAGYRADALLLELDEINTIPANNPASAAVFSADRSNIRLTMCDGVILYEDREYKSIDIESLKYNFKRAVSEIFG